MIAILEVHLGDDGIWEAFEAPVFGSDDVETVESLDHLRGIDAQVRLRGSIRKMVVYRSSDEDGVITRP